MKLMEQIDISMLPEEAKKELIDFYKFLKEKYIEERKKFFLKK